MQRILAVSLLLLACAAACANEDSTDPATDQGTGAAGTGGTSAGGGAGTGGTSVGDGAGKGGTSAEDGAGKGGTSVGDAAGTGGTSAGDDAGMGGMAGDTAMGGMSATDGVAGKPVTSGAPLLEGTCYATIKRVCAVEVRDCGADPACSAFWDCFTACPTLSDGSPEDDCVAGCPEPAVENASLAALEYCVAQTILVPGGMLRSAAPGCPPELF